MTREQAQAEREAFNAFCDGAKIEEQATGGAWSATESPCWSCNIKHRVKRAPRMVPLEAALDLVNMAMADLNRDLRERAEKPEVGS